MINSNLLDVLQCPNCGEESLQPDLVPTNSGQRGTLNCSACSSEYAVREDIPDLIPEKRLDNAQWRLWRDHLDGYFARDKFRQEKPSTSQERRWKKKLDSFCRFIALQEGNVLDVGCGPGRLRLRLNPKRTRYYGIDPLPNPEVSEFPFTRAIAEYLPFRDNTFAYVVVRSALDHFCDLDAFFRETVRVLQPNGRLFLEQVIHEVTGPVSAMKGLVHCVKDRIDYFRTPRQADAAPKHMNEFTKISVMEFLSSHFDLEKTQEYAPNWYTPTQLFIALKPKP